MTPHDRQRGKEIVRQIGQAVAADMTTQEFWDLSFWDDSPSVKVSQFTVYDDSVTLRLDWSDCDGDGNPTFDADFYNAKTGKHRKLAGERLRAHNTNPSGSGERSYEWTFRSETWRFMVAITWGLNTEPASATFRASPARLDKKPVDGE
jgi:hypothetical protein